MKKKRMMMKKEIVKMMKRAKTKMKIIMKLKTQI